MDSTSLDLSYSIAVFFVVLISGCTLNFLKQHFIFQLTGLAFLFTFFVFKLSFVVANESELSIRDVYMTSMPILVSIAACLVSMALGFWIFPPIRKKLKS